MNDANRDRGYAKGVGRKGPKGFSWFVSSSETNRKKSEQIE